MAEPGTHEATDETAEQDDGPAADTVRDLGGLMDLYHDITRKDGTS